MELFENQVFEEKINYVSSKGELHFLLPGKAGSETTFSQRRDINGPHQAGVDIPVLIVGRVEMLFPSFQH